MALSGDNPAISRHEAVAELYGRIILAWLSEQPKRTGTMDDAARDLGLDQVQLAMGLNWCRRHGYVGAANPGEMLPRVSLGLSSDSPEEARAEFMRWVMERASENAGRREPFGGIPRVSRPSKPRKSGGDRRDFFGPTEKRLFFGLFALLGGVGSVAAVTDQIADWPEPRRFALALALFFGVALSLFLAEVFVSVRIGPKKKDAPDSDEADDLLEDDL
ncbi:MAG: hypothetical protein JW910_19890 [Anaerolineae bacterium]|nr:hypothetical protein [Anaerolineae bacterium]